MYEAFYKLRDKPFSLLPDPEFLYLSQKHQMALTLLEYSLWNQASFSVITGDIGTGKTTLIRHLLNKFDSEIVVGLISNTHSSFGELLHWVLLAFNIDGSGKDKVAMYKAFVDFLIQEYAANRRAVLIIDEAQNLNQQTLEELRMLSNINAEKDQLLQVILVGQVGLRERLCHPGLEQFAQRIAVDYHLEPLSAEEAKNYIHHRLKVVGGDSNLFSDEACKAVFLHSGGIPRLINILCDTSLVYAYAEQRTCIDVDIVNDVVRDKQKGSILPLRDQRLAGDTNINEAGSGRVAHLAQDHSASFRGAKKQLRILIASDSESQRTYLKMVLERSGMQVISVVPISEQLLYPFDQNSVDVILVDFDVNIEREPHSIDNFLEYLQNKYRVPVLFNDSSSLAQDKLGGDLGRELTLKLTSLAGRG